MSCNFCEILIENDNEIYRDEFITALLDSDPITKGHIIILPNQHYLDLDEIPDAIINRIFKLSKEYVRLLKEKFGAPGYSIMQNGGMFNDIRHFHVHVFPRFTKEEFSWTYGALSDSDATDFEFLKGQFQEALALRMK